MTKIWKLRPPSPESPNLARQTGLPLLAAQILINRGISDEASARSFLSPRLSDITDPILLKDMDRASDTIVAALEKQENITVYGDFDADGLTATALLLNFFSHLGIQAFFYIPNRFDEGHGLHREAIQKIARERGGLMVTVDCGTGNQREIDLAAKMGLQVVLTDHHQVPEDFKPACPFVNPHRPGCPFPSKNLSGVGLAFFLAIALRRRLRERDWFGSCEEPDLRSFLDLVALGTVADMVPLLDQNRILVSAGIERMKNSRWPGLRAIRETLDVRPSDISSSDLAFRFAPRLNASGRMGQADTGIEILTTKQLSVAQKLAGQLDSMNLRRQDLEQQIMGEIEDRLIPLVDLSKRRTLVFSGEGWHRGVLGIVASRLMDKYHRPVLLLDIKNGTATGSGRSIEGLNLYHSLSRVRYLLDRFGGHHRAAGLSLKVSNIPALCEEMEHFAQQNLEEKDLIPSFEIDAVASLKELTFETIGRLEALAPFGSGNPDPLVYTQDLTVLDSTVLAEKHLKLRVQQEGVIREAIGFGLSRFHSLRGTTVHMVHTPEINKWKGYEKVHLRISDLKIAGGNSKLPNWEPLGSAQKHVHRIGAQIQVECGRSDRAKPQE